MTILRLIILGITSACFAVFLWGSFRFFVARERPTGRLVLLFVFASLTSLIELGAIAVSPNFGTIRGGIAGAILLFAIGLYLECIRTHRERRLTIAFSSDSPNHLVQSGPYRWVRHPFYLSYLAAYFAGFLASGELLLIANLALLYLCFYDAAKFEESKFASTPLAKQYEEYRKQTGMFFPRLKTRGYTQNSAAPTK